jgi:hypothetical protein
MGIFVVQWLAGHPVNPKNIKDLGRRSNMSASYKNTNTYTVIITMLFG